MTDLDRRGFLTSLCGAGAASAAAVAAPDDAHAVWRAPKPMPPKAVGMLYDSTLCIGCKACVDACKTANGMPDEIPPEHAGWNEGTWDSAVSLSGSTLNVIQAYRNGTMEAKDREVDGFAFMKRHCLHCVDPSCVSVCPVSAMIKDPVTGIVSHNPDACIGCRYCVYGCPFGVPQYNVSDPFGKIAKCKFCSHIQEKGGIPACCDVCPTGASLFGLVEDLTAETERRLAAAPGSTYLFPRGRLGDNRPPHEAQIPTYIKAVYGPEAAGGTQVHYIASVPFEKLGLPTVPKESYARLSEGVQHTIYKFFILPILALGGLMFAARRNASAKRGATGGDSV